jgi:hypothetical protein
MKNFEFGCIMLSACALAAMLASCGGSQPPINAQGGTSDNRNSFPYHKTFLFTGTQQSFKVPGSVTKLEVVARGAAGAGEPGESYFGRGGRVYAIIPVHPRETLYVFVGGQGSATGGFNGGGNAGTSPSFSYGYGGGGASDVREGGHPVDHRILIAAGGGGQGCCLYNGSAGGKGGRGIGEAGASTYYGVGGGGGGTQSRGGAGGSGNVASQDGFAGRLGHGGRGGDAAYYGSCNSSNYRCEGGGGAGGGGGYYGGGGGGGGVNGYAVGQPGAGGGGGSSYIEPIASRVRLWRGWKNANGNGLVVFSWK